MKLEQQVTSLETSKRLKELGVKQESLFYWADRVWLGGRKNESFIAYGIPNNPDYLADYSAFTVAELGEILPDCLVGDEGMRFDFNSWRDDARKWCVGYWWDEDSRRLSNAHFENQIALNEVDVRGKMLIYLLENNLLK